MRTKPSLFLFASLIPATLLLSAGSGAAAQATHAHAQTAEDAPPAAMRRLRWSDPATWPEGRVPREGDAVTIARDMDVLLDVAPPALRSLTVDGRLRFSDERDIELATEWIYLRGGELAIGSADKPYTRNATITLTDKVPGEDINTMGDRGIVLMRGTLSLHGDREHTWSKLARTADAGSTQIEVLDASGWRRGDEIVLASTDFDPRQAEKRTITAVRGNAITLDRPLQYMHFGKITFGVDERGEVGLLTRNIRIQASDDAESSYFGGHIMAMAGSKVQVSGVELSRMGQHLHLARYPMHWHLLGEGRASTSGTRRSTTPIAAAVTVHGTNNVRVENNVTFNTVGHCFFLEDAVETGNQFVHNLGIQTKCHPTLPCSPTNLAPGGGTAGAGPAGQRSKDVLLPSDNTVSTFWITNPNNHFVDNVAAGSDQIGFWFAFPEHPIGQFEGTEISANTWPRRMPVGTFRGNTAHSNFDGMMFDRGPRPDNTFSVVGSNYHTARVDPTNPDSERLETVFEDFTGYKNRHGAIWGRGKLHLFRNLKLADNAIGFTHAAGDLASNAYSSKVVDSLFVGESDNIGNPRTPGEIAYGRTLPQEQADYPIRGYEYYDFRQEVDNVTFVNSRTTPRATRARFPTSCTPASGSAPRTRWRIWPSRTPSRYISLRSSADGPPILGVVRAGRARSSTTRTARWARSPILTSLSTTGSRPTTRPARSSRPGTPPYARAISVVLESVRSAALVPAAQADPAHPVVRAPAAPEGLPVLGEPGGPAPAFPVVPAAVAWQGPEFAPLLHRSRSAGTAGSSNTLGETTIHSGAEVKVDTARNAVSLSLREMDQGSWVIFELPGFATAAGGAKQSSLAALRNAGATSYYKDGGTLWVKLVVGDSGGPVAATLGALAPRASIDVSR